MPDPSTPSSSSQVFLRSAITLCAGLAIVWTDSRPGWDDTGITAGAVLIAAAAASLARIRPWLAATLIAGPMVAVEISGGTGVLLAVPIAIAGAYGGAFLRRLMVEW